MIKASFFLYVCKRIWREWETCFTGTAREGYVKAVLIAGTCQK